MLRIACTVLAILCFVSTGAEARRGDPGQRRCCVATYCWFTAPGAACIGKSSKRSHAVRATDRRHGQAARRYGKTGTQRHVAEGAGVGSANTAPWAASALASVAGRYLGGNPTGWGRVWCGVFMRLVVRQAGLPDNPAGNLARSWAHYGRPTGAQPGAIAVMPHHVGIVLAIQGDRVLVRSGNHGHRVADGWYPARRIIAYRVAAANDNGVPLRWAA
jgi:hypothetical protein